MDSRIEKRNATRRAIVKAATKLFGACGYADVSIEHVLVKANLSRGALYHYFCDKRALFAAVFEATEEWVAKETRARASTVADPREALLAACESFLDLALRPAVRRIVLIDAPAVLGWEEWREIESRHGFGLMKVALARANTEGMIPSAIVETYAHILLASLAETAMLIARANERAAAARSGKTAIRMLVERLLVRPVPSPSDMPK